MKSAFKVFIAFLAALLLASCASPQPSSSDSFKFIQISDIHLGASHLNAKRAVKVARQIDELQLKIDFVVITGDIFDKAAMNPADINDFKEMLSILKPPVHCLPGNHDVLPGQEAATAQAFEKVAGPLFSTFETHGVSMMLLFAEPLAGELDFKGQNPLDYLESALAKSGGKPVIIFLHTPPCEDMHSAKVYKPGWTEQSVKRFSSILAANKNVKAIVAGHFHRDELHEFQGVPLFISPPVASKWGRQATYRVYTWKDGRLQYSTQYFNHE